MARIDTRRLELLASSEATLRAELEGTSALAAALDCDIPASWPPDLYDADAVNYSLNWLLAHPTDAAWSFYYIVRRPVGASRRLLIGAGGFKGPADDQGVVEVGYSIVRDHQRLGYATEAVEGWLRFAFASPDVKMVIGQTLPTLIPSIGVLEKLGFRFAGAGADPNAPEGEQVIRYEMTRDQFERRTRVVSR
jgi:RimJ/RimL family protein N-acetyltransferase